MLVVVHLLKDGPDHAPVVHGNDLIPEEAKDGSHLVLGILEYFFAQEVIEGVEGYKGHRGNDHHQGDDDPHAEGGKIDLDLHGMLTSNPL
jgi:hypothetical protein